MSFRLETIDVYADLEHLEGPVKMGALRCQRGRSGEIISFEYDASWLKRPEAIAFDPDLALVSGPQYPRSGRAGFGIFQDSSPDRWGRVLMQRRENLRARA
jgi:serine/threonine-protein kinase HipA